MKGNGERSGMVNGRERSWSIKDEFSKKGKGTVTVTYIKRKIFPGKKYRIPLLVPGVDPFSNANIYALDQLIAETKTDLEFTTCPLLSLILH